MKEINILFVCIHNSARSQMAEAFINNCGKEYISADSAGLEPGKLNPLVVEVMKEKGIDISNNGTKSVFEFLKQKRDYDYVITVCDEASGERCPVFPGGAKRLHWGFADPSSLAGSYDEKLKTTRKIRDQIEEKINNLLKNL